MSLDITTLRVLKRRDAYEKLYKSVPAAAISEHTRIILKDYGRYFTEIPTAAIIEPEPFMFWLKVARPRLSDEARAIIEHAVRQIASDPDPGVVAGLLDRLHAAASAARVADLIDKWTNGDEVDLYQALREEVTQLEENLSKKQKTGQILTPIEELLKDEENDTGLQWRLPCLNRHIKPLRPGDFVIVAARPDVGKTTFCSDQFTHMASQVDTLYPGQKRSVLWFNNEGPGRRIVLRNFQAALNATVEDLTALQAQPCSTPELAERYQHRLREQYANALGGRPGVLRVFDIHDMWNHEVEDLMKRYPPALVIFDMIDNIKFGGAVANNGQRTDQLLEAMYQWARMMGVKHDAAIVATSQVSADGEGLQYPTLGMLKDSKTGKQGAADVIITIGTNPELPQSRYIGCTKNKKVRTGVAKSPQVEVRMDGDRGRYVEYTK